MEVKETPENKAIALIWQAAKSPLKAFVQSKKFKALAIGLVASVLTMLAGLIAAHYHVSEEMINSLATKVTGSIQYVLVAYLGGQSIVDAALQVVSKSASKENGEATK